MILSTFFIRLSSGNSLEPFWFIEYVTDEALASCLKNIFLIVGN